MLLLAFILSNIAFIILGVIAIYLQIGKHWLSPFMWIVIVLGAVSLVLRYMALF